jgi:hypothetical protein
MSAFQRQDAKNSNQRIMDLILHNSVLEKILFQNVLKPQGPSYLELLNLVSNWSMFVTNKMRSGQVETVFSLLEVSMRTISQLSEYNGKGINTKRAT